jgi:hypothetical protein
MYDRGGVVIDLNANSYPQAKVQRMNEAMIRIEMMVFL